MYSGQIILYNFYSKKICRLFLEKYQFSVLPAYKVQIFRWSCRTKCYILHNPHNTVKLDLCNTFNLLFEIVFEYLQFQGLLHKLHMVTANNALFFTAWALCFSCPMSGRSAGSKASFTTTLPSYQRYLKTYGRYPGEKYSQNTCSKTCKRSLTARFYKI